MDQPECELERSDNPFALVILTVKAALNREKGKYTGAEYLRRKLELARWLEGKTLPEDQRRSLLSFLKYYLPLKDRKLEKKFNEQLNERSRAMGIVEYLINEAKEEALEQGRETEKLFFVRSLLANTDFGDEKISLLANVDLDLVMKLRTGAAGMSETEL